MSASKIKHLALVARVCGEHTEVSMWRALECRLAHLGVR
ncbi:hypothetical protein M2163_000736 [Streptomyces sp. SAI-135]|jgi:hypothetical protein|nr:hypothetical protein [Streptomyces sp. SAI-090]MDH6613628.1 hypothetical protein [Streptomyces sp. SAI-135]